MSASHAAFRIQIRKGRSTSDIVWAHRWLAAKSIRYRKTLYVLGLDMSRAFEPFETTVNIIGTPQGDGLSPIILFELRSLL